MEACERARKGAGGRRCRNAIDESTQSQPRRAGKASADEFAATMRRSGAGGGKKERNDGAGLKESWRL